MEELHMNGIISDKWQRWHKLTALSSGSSILAINATYSPFSTVAGICYQTVMGCLEIAVWKLLVFLWYVFFFLGLKGYWVYFLKKVIISLYMCVQSNRKVFLCPLLFHS